MPCEILAVDLCRQKKSINNLNKNKMKTKETFLTEIKNSKELIIENTNLSNELADDVYEKMIEMVEDADDDDVFFDALNFMFDAKKELGYDSLGKEEKGLRGIMGKISEIHENNNEKFNPITKDWEKQ